MKIKFEGKIKDLNDILKRLIEKYGNISLSETIKQEYRRENVCIN